MPLIVCVPQRVVVLPLGKVVKRGGGRRPGPEGLVAAGKLGQHLPLDPVDRQVARSLRADLARRPDRVTGKTQTFRGAVFPGDESLRGSLVRMKVTASKGMTLEGEPVAVTTGASL